MERYALNSTIYHLWSTTGADGGSITRATDGSIRIYRNNSTTQRSSSAGITDTEDFDSVTGLHMLTIDTSDNTDAGFYAVGYTYHAVLVGAVVDGITVNVPIGLKWSFDPIPANAVQISGDTVAADNAESFFDGTGYAGTGNVIPTVTSVTNMVTANVTQISGDSVAADNLEAAADGTGYNLGGGSVVAASVTGAVGSVTGNVGGNVTGSVGSVAAGGITAASIATDAIDADALASDAVTEIAAGISVPSAAAIADAVWDEATSGHSTAGTTGKALTDASSGGSAPTASAIADAVWDEALSGHATAGSAGAALDAASAGGLGLNSDQITGLKRTITAIVGVGGETATPGVLEFDMIGESTTLRITQSTDGDERLDVEEF